MNIEAPCKIAVFSDIHGNLHALDKALELIDELAVDCSVCCGDVVGYGAFPNECIERLRQRHIPTLAGNHDHAALGLTETRFFNEIARKAVEWTRDRLSPENALWLRDRPFSLTIEPGLLFVHASPIHPSDWGYVLTFGEARGCFDQYPQRFCFIGHSHQPAVVVKNGNDLASPQNRIVPLHEGCRYLINVGSIGQPRDRNPLGCFVTIDLNRQRLEFHRFEYDIQGAQQAILEAGLPEELAHRLSFGW